MNTLLQLNMEHQTLLALGYIVFSDKKGWSDQEIPVQILIRCICMVCLLFFSLAGLVDVVKLLGELL